MIPHRKHRILKPKRHSSVFLTPVRAAAYGGSLALQYMEKGNIKPNQHVLIYGASGTSGTIAVQYAKHLGAHITGVCSTNNLEFVKSLGAESVIDYTTTDSVGLEVEFNFVLDSVGKIKNSPHYYPLYLCLYPVLLSESA